MTINKIFTVICGLLVIINVTYFVKGVKLSDEISYYESEVKKIKQQNAEYEQTIYTLESLTKTASHAAELDFDKYNDPIFTDKPQYAFNN